MSDDTLEELLSHTVRWCGNVLAELQRNYAPRLSTYARGNLRRAVTALGELEGSRSVISTSGGGPDLPEFDSARELDALLTNAALVQQLDCDVAVVGHRSGEVRKEVEAKEKTADSPR